MEFLIATPNHVKILSGKKYCNAGRSNGTISFLSGLTFKTTTDITTLIMPAPNYFIDGGHSFTTLLSTSFFSGEIPCVWKITCPDKVITIPANTPVAAIIPINLNNLNKSEVNLYDGNNYIGANFDGGEYGRTVDNINQRGEWAGFYRAATDHKGNKIGEHELKALRLSTNVK